MPPGSAAAALVLFTVFMAGVAETLAGRIPASRRSTSPRRRPFAVVPWFFAGALFPIGALPAALTAIAKVLPLTHVLALLRYGLVDPLRHRPARHGALHSTTTEACLSLAVVVVAALGMTALAVRTFTRSALR